MTIAEDEIRSYALSAPPTRGFNTARSQPMALELVVELAHDFRSPLAAVLILTEMLERGRSGPLTPRQHAQVRLIYSAVRSLCEATTGVMELARGGGVDEHAARVPFAVSDILANVGDVVRPVATARGLKLHILSSVRGERMGHPRSVERVLLNLVTNALKFTDHGSVELSVRSEGARRDRVCFAVRDSGRGISGHAVRSLLEPFPVPTAERPHGFSGTGLGLAVCQRLVTAMGSTLRLDSRSEHGSRFYFTLDLPPATLEADQLSGAAAPLRRSVIRRGTSTPHAHRG